MSTERILKEYERPQWLLDAHKQSKPEEILKIFIKNRDKLEVYISKINDDHIIYRLINWLFFVVFKIAWATDWIMEKIQSVFLKIPLLQYITKKTIGFRNNFNLQTLALFLRAKLYSLVHAPHNERAIKRIEEIIKFTAKHNLDFNKHFPEIKERFSDKKAQLMQHKFFQEFTKGWAEKLLAIPFDFERSINPVLPDSSLWHKIYSFLETILVKDIILVDKSNNRVSLKNSSKKELKNSETIKKLEEISKIKNKGNRIFFVGHHEGYLSPYFVRTVLREAGFDNLTKNCNTVVGPRMLSNLILRSGAANVGNLFTAIPSQKTKAIKTKGLAEELKKAGNKSQFLIKMPNLGLDLIAMLNYEDFLATIINFNQEKFDFYTKSNDKAKVSELFDYINTQEAKDVMQLFKKEEYKLFKEVMREPFLIFPEGSRSYMDDDGSVVLKYVNPKYIPAYMREGDYIVPISLVGGTDMTKGLFMSVATLGLSIGKHFKLSSTMIENYKEEGISVMKEIAKLKNLKQVKFNEDIQERKEHKFKKKRKAEK